MTNNFSKEFPEEWDQFVKTVSQVWVDYYSYWVSQAKQKSLPVLFVRFEDLVQQPKQTMKEIMEFILGVDSIDKMNVMRRIN